MSEDSEVAALRLKAIGGDADAQLCLGVAYRIGRGVPQDDAQAATWYLKAADQGDADAQFRLGYAYRLGRGVPQDDAQAAVWYLKAADQGDADTQVHLGAMYYLGQGVPKAYVEAHKWRNLAASRASAERQKEYAEDSDAVAKAMTPAQIAEAQKLAREWVAAFEQRGGK